MVAKLDGKRVLVLSDDNKLYRLIEVALSSVGAHVMPPKPTTPGQPRPRFGRLDLIVVALSSPYSESAVVLAQANLSGRIGRVPLLIISDRPFSPAPGSRIAHLDFPFRVDALQDKIEQFLHQQAFPRGDMRAPGDDCNH